MYEHSIKVPRLYKTAAKIAQKVKEDGSSLKQLVYERKHPNIKALYALVLQTLQNDDNLNAIIRHSQLLTKENRLDPWLARVLITELLWGKKKLSGECKPIKTILSYQDKFLEDFTPQKKNKPKTKKVVKPKYVRINTLKLSIEEAIENFRYEGWSLVRCGDGSDYAAFLATSASLSEDQFMMDILVKDLLLFPPGTQFYEHKYYKNGCIVLQDKSSCLAPLLLNPPVGARILDMCAAPGMKCMHLAALAGKTGKVYGVERDQRRYETLIKLLTNADASNVETINKDVLTLTDADIPDIEYILVDPSCSGSGMLDRVEFEDESSKCNESRLQKLAGFQITILRHALNNFKTAKRVIYSTCSLYTQENEEVIQQTITTTPDFKLVPLNETLKDKWYNFGSKDFGKIGESCLYARPELDHTNGFFIALFERVKDGEKNEHFIKRVHRSSECENINENNTENENYENYTQKEDYENYTEKEYYENYTEKNNYENYLEKEDYEDNASNNKKFKNSKKSKKEKHKNVEECKLDNLQDVELNENVENVKKEKSKKRKKPAENEEECNIENENLENKSKKLKIKELKVDIDSIKDDTYSNEEKKKLKKSKKKHTNVEENMEAITENNENQRKEKKKKKKKEADDIEENQQKEKKKKKKKEAEDIEENQQKEKKKKKKKEAEDIEENQQKEKKKKKKKDSKDIEENMEMTENIENIILENDKKKKKKNKEVKEITEFIDENNEINSEHKKSKKNKNKKIHLEESTENGIQVDVPKKNKKGKKKSKSEEIMD